MNLLAAFSLASFQKFRLGLGSAPIDADCVVAQLRNYSRLAESWTILHAAEVFDSVTRNEDATNEESRQEGRGNQKGAGGTL